MAEQLRDTQAAAAAATQRAEQAAADLDQMTARAAAVEQREADLTAQLETAGHRHDELAAPLARQTTQLEQITRNETPRPPAPTSWPRASRG